MSPKRIDYADTMRYLLIIALFITLPLSAEVYRSVDKDGNVVFSDEESPGSEKVIVPEVQTISPPAAGPSTYKRPALKTMAYKELAVASPADDEAVRDNAGNISVSVTFQPELFFGDTLVLYMDGTEVGSNKQGSFSLKNVDRGTHQLRAVIKDSNGRIRKSSKSSSFHMLRHFAKPGG